MKLRRAKGIARVLAPQMWGPRGASLFFLVFAFILFTMSAVSPGNLQSVRTSVMDLFAPVLAAANAPIQGAANYVRAITGLAALQEENARLLAENARLRDWYQAAQQLEARNKSLESLLHAVPETTGGFVTARVVADSGNSFARSMMVLAGTQDGVEKGQPVLAADGLIGRVIETGNRAARVLMLTDINSRIPVLVEGKNWRAILAGTNDDWPRLDHLPPESLKELVEGQRIVTSGHGGLFPYGLPVGEIVRSADGSWRVVPFANDDRLVFVRIIDKVNDPFLQLAPRAAAE